MGLFRANAREEIAAFMPDQNFLRKRLRTLTGNQCTCEIVGYAMGAKMTQELAISALNMAIQHRRPPPGLVHHSDRGSPYCAKVYRAILQENGLVASMSRKGNGYDNTPHRELLGQP